MNKLSYEDIEHNEPNTEELKEFVQPMDVQQSIDSAYLLNQKTLFRDHNNKCKIVECEHLQRICEVLQKYHNNISKLNINDESPNNATDFEEIDIVSILNDKNHLLFCHFNEFEDIYKIIIQRSNNNHECSLSNCLLMRRNHRNRSIMTQKENVLIKLYFNKKIFTQQILDSIHCTYFHTFDTGYKLTKLEKQSIINDEININDDLMEIDDDINVQEINNIINTTRNTYRNVQGLERLCRKNNKFTIKTEQNKLDVFSYGYRYFYWSHYKNNDNIHDDAHNFAHFKWTGDPPTANVGSTVGDWFIDRKYVNFKTELIDNEICHIGSVQWNVFTDSATAHLCTDYVRHLKCPRTQSAVYYEMKENDLMSKDHLIAMMVYCGCDLLQNKFSVTFRHKDKNETNHEMKQRHRNYYHFGRLLRECVECFGMEKKNTKLYNEIILYHGVNKQFVYSSMYAYIKGPISTTLSYNVALVFSCNTGMIIELQLITEQWSFKNNEGTAAHLRKTCVDISWISEYQNEQEIFTIGGLNKFYFNTMIDASTCINYQLYIKGIKQMTFCMTAGFYLQSSASTQQESQMVYRLMTHELSRYFPHDKRFPSWNGCPDYIKSTLHSHCLNITKITFFTLDDPHGNSKLHDVILRYKNGWIKIQIITKLFFNLKYISVGINDMRELQQPFIYQSMLRFISNNTTMSLHIVEIVIGNIDEQKEQLVAKYIKQYESAFGKHSWSIYIESREDIYDVLSIIQETPQAIGNLEREVKIIFKSQYI